MSSPNANDLKQIPVFASLSDGDRKLLADHLQVREFPAGSMLLAEGQKNESFYILREGEVDVTVSGAARRTLRPGAFFGEISMEQAVPVSASLVARTPVTVYVLDHSQFQAVINNPESGVRIRGIMTDRQASDRLFS